MAPQESGEMYLETILIRLGVSPETASADACKMEHVIHDETFDTMKRHMDM